MRALLIGDVVGGVGLKALLARLPGLREAHRPDVVVVNAENAAAGAGTSPRQAHDLLEAGVDVITGGNHTLQKREIYPLLQSEPRLLRPANIAARAPGRGLVTVETAGGPVSVVNVMGSVFMTAAHSPFAVIDDLVDEARRGRTWCSSTSTPRPPARRSRSAGTSTGASRPSWARTRTCRPPTPGSCPRARPTSATWA